MAHVVRTVLVVVTFDVHRSLVAESGALRVVVLEVRSLLVVVRVAASVVRVRRVVPLMGEKDGKRERARLMLEIVCRRRDKLFAKRPNPFYLDKLAHGNFGR